MASESGRVGVLVVWAPLHSLNFHERMEPASGRLPPVETVGVRPEAVVPGLDFITEYISEIPDEGR